MVSMVKWVSFTQIQKTVRDRSLHLFQNGPDQTHLTHHGLLIPPGSLTPRALRPAGSCRGQILVFLDAKKLTSCLTASACVNEPLSVSERATPSYRNTVWLPFRSVIY